MGANERPEASDVGPRLLEILRGELGEPGLEWARAPELLGDGVTARAFACQLRGATGLAQAPLVCRVFCDGAEGLPPDQVRVEALIQNELAAAGFPAPRVLTHGDARAGLGFPFLVMERVPGRNAFPVLVGALLVATAALWIGAGGLLASVLIGYWLSMARLLRRLHGVSGQRVRDALVEAGVSPDRAGLEHLLETLRDQVRETSSNGGARVLEWLERNRPDAPEPPVVCHGDYWVGNLMLSLSRVTLLDWTQSALSHRELDLGWIAIQHYSRVPLPIADPLFDWLWLPVRPLTWLLMSPIGFVYRLRGGVDPERVRYFAVLRALGLLAEGARLARTATSDAAPALLRAWGSPHTALLLRWRIRRITGIDPGVL